MAETRTRRTQSAKSEQTDAENKAAEDRKAEAEAKRAEKQKADDEAKAKREQERKEREEKRAQEKAEREAKKEQEKKEREEKRAAEKEAKEREKIEARQADIDAGNLIFANFDGDKVDSSDVNGSWEGVTYTLVSEPKKEEVAQRALSVITDLQNDATEVPMPGKDLADEYGGGTVQWVAFFGMLRVLGLVKAYRFKSGERGGSGMAYLWVGPTEPYTLEQAGDIAEQAEEGEPAAA